jgi:hypothetical protein
MSRPYFSLASLEETTAVKEEISRTNQGLFLPVSILLQN